MAWMDWNALSAFVVWLALEIVFRLAEKWREGRK